MILALRRFAATFLLTSATAALAACGGSGGGGGESQGIGHGDITLTGMTPNPVQGCEPVPFQITGTNFETVTGVTAKVTFRAILPVGIQPFGRGSTDHASVTANITSDTTIDGLTPPIVICGIPSITVEVDVMLESGVQATSTGVFTVVFNAPTITAINPNPLPAAIATPFVISGTGFPAIGTPATVRFTGDNGALLFKDGTKPFADVFGVVGPLANQISGDLRRVRTNFEPGNLASNSRYRSGHGQSSNES